MSHYDSIFHQLKESMLKANNYESARQQQEFIEEKFKWINEFYEKRQINLQEYRILLDRLAAYKSGIFNDYIDILTGAASMGMLELALHRGDLFGPDVARKRSKTITRMTDTPPQKPIE
jgi:predicted glycosyl hydrolase (DUF1957 family)